MSVTDVSHFCRHFIYVNRLVVVIFNLIYFYV